jgi:hypothetical protein
MSTKSCTFCMHPFTGLATNEDGKILVCCRSHPISNINKESLEEAWNNDNMRRIRRQVLNNERPPECQPCFGLEDQGVESLRQRHIKGVIPEARINLYPNALDNLQDDYFMPFEVPTMEFKNNNLCNLKCRMCHPLDSTSWNDWDEVEEFYIKEGNFLPKVINELGLKKKPFIDSFTGKDHFWENLERNAPYFRRVEFAGGEPLMDPYHYKILDVLSKYGENIEIKYATNGTTLGIKGGRTIHDYWPKFKSIAVNVSLDGVGEVYEHIRGNANWNEVVANIREMQKFTNISRIVGACTVQVGNVMHLDNILRTFTNDLNIVFHTHRVEYPKVLSIQTIPQELKLKVVQTLTDLKTEILEYPMVQKYPILEKHILTQLQDNINYIQANDQTNLWPDTIDFNTRLDKSRNQKPFYEITPEYKRFINV